MYTRDVPTACENCTTPLGGAFCHACGQAAANPLRHTGHAIEEVFESFWHLDGRVFRTLRELFRPGQIASAYLAGHRVCYIAPLRLFVVLTVLTFFIGTLTLDRGEPVSIVQVDTRDQNFDRATTVVEVERRLERALSELREERRAAGWVPGAAQAFEQSEREVRAQAAKRIVSLRRAQPSAADGSRLPTPAAPAAAAQPVSIGAGTVAANAGGVAGRAAAKDEEGESFNDVVSELSVGTRRNPRQPWHETDNPFDVAWLPPVGDRWLNHKLGNAERNTKRFNGGEASFVRAMLAAVPSALFVLVPVFALLLRLLYLRSGHGYLEHLVVALYSHAFLLISLLALFMLQGIGGAIAPQSGAHAALSLGRVAVWVWVPIYLLLMQRRVYGQGWLATTAKYLVLGVAYLMLVTFVAIYAALASLTTD